MVTRWSRPTWLLYGTLGLVSAWMGDRLRAGKLSQYVTSLRGYRRNEYQLRLGRWRRTGHASRAIAVYPPTGSTAYEREMSSPPTLLRSMALLYLFLKFRLWVIQVITVNGTTQEIIYDFLLACY